MQTVRCYQGTLYNVAVGQDPNKATARVYHVVHKKMALTWPKKVKRIEKRGKQSQILPVYSWYLRTEEVGCTRSYSLTL